MAVGKVFEHPVLLDDLFIRFGSGSLGMTVTAENLNAKKVNLDSISKYLRKNDVQLEVKVGNSRYAETVWGLRLLVQHQCSFLRK